MVEQPPTSGIYAGRLYRIYRFLRPDSMARTVWESHIA